jgi:glutathione peroxidase
MLDVDQGSLKNKLFTFSKIKRRIMRSYLTVFFCLLFVTCVAQKKHVPSSIYGFKLKAYDGSVINFSQLKGKKILIVNAPENADNSHQYAELEALYQKYKDKLVIIGCLADDFQIPPGSKRNVAMPKHYNVTFPLAAKVIVKGDKMSPIYKWLTQKKYNHYRDTEIAWDFHKFLIDREGKLIAIFAPTVLATDPQLISAIEQ